MKLNKLFYLLVAVSAFFVACNNTDNTEIKGTLEVTENAVDVKFFGGEGVINYTITGGNANSKPSVTSSSDWVNNIVIDDKISFNVDLNNLAEKRTAMLTITYGKQSFDVFVRQDAGYEIDVEFTAGALNGEYYGTAYSSIPNYFAILSKNGTTGYMDHYLDTYYRLDMFHTDAAGDPLTLPQGVYEYDPLAEGNKVSFGGFYSLMFKTHEDGGYTEQHFSDGVVIVTENKIEAILVLETGEVHHVVYEGSLELGWVKFEEPDFLSTLTEDFTINETGGHLRLVNYGDVFDVGANNWSVSMTGADENSNYNYFMLNVITDDMSTSIDSILGTYTGAVENAAKNTFLVGALDGTQYVGSWYTGVAGGLIDHGDRAPLTSGTITIAKDGSNYVVTYDCMDDNGHKITGTYSCIDVVDYSSQQ